MQEIVRICLYCKHANPESDQKVTCDMTQDDIDDLWSGCDKFQEGN